MTPVAETEAIEQKALTTVDKAKLMVVTTPVQRFQASEVGRAIAALESEAVEFFRPMKQAAAKTHKEICARENSVVEPLKEAKQYLSRQIGSFDQEQEKKRREEEARIQRQLREQAEAEERQRAADQAIADALELEAAGDTKGAEAVLSHPVVQPVYVPPVVLQREVIKTAGVASAQTWQIRITDVNAIPREYMIPDEKMLGQMARAMKDKFKVPGVEAYSVGGARFSKA